MQFLQRYLGDWTWSHAKIPDLSGKTYIVTGASSGIGYEAAKRLAEHKGRVVLAVRNEERCEDALAAIRKEVPHADLDYIPLNLSSFQSVREFADKFKSQHGKLHCLVNNAGVQIPKGPEKTEDGFEIHVGTDFLGHFYLTHLLLDSLRQNAPSRVVFMSSPQEARSPGVPWDDLGGEFVRPGESDMNWYGTANLCKIMVAKEMARRLEGSGVDVFVVQPGTSQTDLFPKQDFEKKESTMLDVLQKTAGQSVERGALSTLYCATEPELQGKSGGYYGPWYGSSGMSINAPNTMELEPSSQEGRDPEARSKLYELASKVVAAALGSPLPNKLPRRDATLDAQPRAAAE